MYETHVKHLCFSAFWLSGFSIRIILVFLLLLFFFLQQQDKMIAIRDEAAQSGTPLTGEELSRRVLGETRYYIRGFGVGPVPSSYSFKSNSSAIQQISEKYKADLELLREERRREREEDQMRWEEERRRRDEEQRRKDEEYRSEFEKLTALLMSHINKG